MYFNLSFLLINRNFFLHEIELGHISILGWVMTNKKYQSDADM